MAKENKKEIREIILKLDGVLMDSGSVEYKTLFEIIDGSVGAIEGFARISNLNQIVSYRVRPPRVGSFEISIQAVQLIGVVTLPFIQNAGTIKDVVSIFIEFIKIKKALKGEKLKRENVQTNNNGDLVVKNNTGLIVYNDNRKIVNINVINNAIEDPQINKKIDRIATALEKNEQVDEISFTDPEVKDDVLSIAKEEAKYLKYEEKIEEKPDQLVGNIRMIDNKTNRGIITVLEGEKEKAIDFELEIKDINLLEKIVRNLAIAEANKTRVLFTGERIIQEGKIKKVIVNNVDIPDKSFDF